MMEMADGHKGNYQSQTKAFSFTHGESRHNELRCLTPFVVPPLFANPSALP